MAKRNSILVENEKDATQQVAKVMRITFLIFTIAFILNVLGIFIVRMKIMTISYILGSLFLLTPTILRFVLKKESKWTKYVNTFCAVLFVTIATITLTYHVVVLYIYAIAVASLYFSKKLNRFAAYSSVICVSAGQLIAFYLNTFPDKNLRTVQSVIIFGILPRALILIALATIFTMLTDRTTSLLSNLMGADEQERVLKHMQKMQMQSTETAEKLLHMVQDLSVITNSSTIANEKIVHQTEIVLGGVLDNTNQIKDIHMKIQNMTQQLTNLSTMNSQVASLAESITKTTQVNQDRMDSATSSMEQIHNSAIKCKSIIHDLGEESKQILGIIEVITEISIQTNVLALNATIEAARAGEHGRGFAVVAEEIHKLSVQTKTAVDSIAEIITKVAENTDQAVVAMEESASLTQIGMQAIKEAGSSSSIITTSNTEMSDQIVSMEEIVKTVMTHSSKVAQNMNTVSKNTQKNYNAIHDVTTATQENCAGIASISMMVDQIRDLAAKLSEVVDG